MASSDLTPQEIAALRSAIAKEVTERPPTIGLVGVSGVGKSFTINTLFKTNLPTSDTVACTKEFEATDLALAFTEGEGKNLRVRLRVVDAPGLGEDMSLDPKYIAMYREHLPKCDVVLWVLAARNRAMALDQSYLRELSDFHGRMVFALNQVDIVEPMNWNERINLPSQQQLDNIAEIVNDREEKLASVLRRTAKVHAYSAKRGFALEELFTAIILSTSSERRWILDNLKNFHYADFVPKGVLAELKQGDM